MRASLGLGFFSVSVKKLDTKPDYVTDPEPQAAPDNASIQPPVLERIKKALVTSRLTLAGQNTGTDPYDSRRDRRRAPIWGDRSR
jgi:hypothetical protein